MEINRYMRVLPVVLALLLTASCDNEDNAVIEEPQLAQARIIPYEVTVSNGNVTRATLNDRYHVFQTGDKLFITGTNISGELTLTEGAGTYDATFAGSLTYTGEGDPASGLELTAVLKGPNDEILPATISDFITAGEKPTYPATLAGSPADAVEKYSYIMGTSNYSNKSFSLNQFSSFIDFVVTLEDNTPVGTPISVSIKNGGSKIRSGEVTPKTEDGAIKVKFTAGFMGNGHDAIAPSTTLSGATITLGSKDPISFGGTTTLASYTIYQVKKAIYDLDPTVKYTCTATALSGAINETLTDQTLPINTTIKNLLGTYASMVSAVSFVEVTSGDNVIIGSGSGLDTSVSVIGSGKSVLLVCAEIMGSSQYVEVTVNVTKQAAS